MISRYLIQRRFQSLRLFKARLAFLLLVPVATLLSNSYA